MRAPLLACVLLAGCVGLPLAPDAPAERPGAPAPFESCARLLVTPEAATFPAYQPHVIRLAFHNCGGEAVEVLDDDVCDATLFNVTLHRGDDVLVLRRMSAAHGGAAKHVCGDLMGLSEHVPPGAWLNASLTWNGTFVDRIGPCAMPCDLRMDARPAEPGTYRVVARAGTPRGAVHGEADVTLAPPRVPNADPDADVRFVLNATYRMGETVPVVVENVGERPYAYLAANPACMLTYYTNDGRPFLVPEGTHCDQPIHDMLHPGQRALLFEWTLDECTRDAWGCQQSAPLPPGTYHLRARFYASGVDRSVTPEAYAYAGATIQVVGSAA